MNVLKRATLMAALVAAPLAATQSAEAGIGHCTRYLPGAHAFFDCSANALGVCTYFYDPLADPPQNNVVPQTGEFVGCVV